MKTTYLVWEDPTCDGINPNWLELTGQEFLALVRSAEVAGRYFVKLIDEQEDTAIVIEATKASYLAWMKEKKRREYLKTCAEGKTTVSYHALGSDTCGYGEELLEDKDADVLSDCLKAITRETLKAALETLTEDECRLITFLYLSDRRGTERGYHDAEDALRLLQQNPPQAFVRWADRLHREQAGRGNRRGRSQPFCPPE